MRSWLLAAILVAACSSERGTREAAPPELGASAREAAPPQISASAGEVVLATRRCERGRVTAVWRGEPVKAGHPVEYGFQRLSFRFDDTGEVPFVPRGNLFFSDWQQDIFSPDCRHVLLLQDRFGPYHVVATDRLRAYLEGHAEPELVTVHERSCSFALVHHDARWLSNEELEYRAGGEGIEILRVRLAELSGRAAPRPCPER